jgi:hypothetical protein
MTVNDGLPLDDSTANDVDPTDGEPPTQQLPLPVPVPVPASPTDGSVTGDLFDSTVAR